jgi:predicted GIY-YIG superfamily endonuclease
VPDAKRFVYILESVKQPSQYYVGVTSDPLARLRAHNAGLSPHTASHRPWRTLVVIEFDEEAPALAFERYLKTGSGREFARRHFRQTSRCPGDRSVKTLRSETD